MKLLTLYCAAHFGEIIIQVLKMVLLFVLVGNQDFKLHLLSCNDP